MTSPLRALASLDVEPGRNRGDRITGPEILGADGLPQLRAAAALGITQRQARKRRAEEIRCSPNETSSAPMASRATGTAFPRSAHQIVIVAITPDRTPAS